MKIAVLTICFNEEETIGQVINNWDGLVYKHLVLHSDKPWHGLDLPPDRTEEIVRSFRHTEFIRLPWKSEHDQRNWGLAYLYEYDYVLIVDADEFYTKADQEIILSRIGQKNAFEDNQWCYRIPLIETYFKSLDYRLDPPDGHQPVIAVDPKKIVFIDCRIPSTPYQIPIDGVTMHHATYLRNEKRLRSKLTQFEHHDQVKRNWMDEVYTKWSPEMEDVRAYGSEKSKAILNPAPQEIKDLISTI
jgi:glycosyltransferase involved in cell wall biosynthesis